MPDLLTDHAPALLAEMAEIAAIEASIRRLGMTYQRRLKEEVAADLGLTFAQVNLSYQEWKAIRDPWLKLKGRLL